MNARMGCLTMSAILAAMFAFVLGLGMRTQWHDPDPLQPLPEGTGARLFAAEFAAIQSASFVAQEPAVTAPVVAIPTAAGYSQWRSQVVIHPEECVALVVGVVAGYALPHYGAMIGANEVVLDAIIPQLTPSPATAEPRIFNALVRREGNGAVMTLNWCEHQERTIDVLMIFRSIDGAMPPRRSDATIQSQLLRAPWTAVGGPLNLPRPGVTQAALQRLARETVDPLGQSARQPQPGLFPVGSGTLISMGFATLDPLNGSTLTTLYHLAARDAGVAVNPRVAVQRPEDSATVLNAFIQYSMGRAFPAEHDPIVDLGRNDFYRVLSVLSILNPAESCEIITFARNEGLFTPNVYRYNAVSRVKTLLTSRNHNNVVEDRLCAEDGVIAYIVDDIDQLSYQMTRFVPYNPTPSPSEIARALRGGRAH